MRRAREGCCKEERPRDRAGLYQERRRLWLTGMDGERLGHLRGTRGDWDESEKELERGETVKRAEFEWMGRE